MAVFLGEQLRREEFSSDFQPIILGDGLIGRALAKQLPGAQLLSRRRNGFDFTNREQLRRVLDATPGDFVINAIAYTEVDGAQRDPETAYKINVEHTGYLAQACVDEGLHLIHISSGFVTPHNETMTGLLRESEKPNLEAAHLGVYARSKAIGEAIVQDITGGDVSILRIDYPTTEDGGWLKIVAGYVDAKYDLFQNQIITPTDVRDIKRAIESIAELGAFGIFHVASPVETTPFEYASYMIRKMGIDHNLQAGTLTMPQDLTKKSPRPIHGGLSVSHTQYVLGLNFTPWQDQIDYYLPFLNLNNK